MNKLIAILVAVAILASMSVSVSAATTNLTTIVPEAAYTLNIPADQEIPFGTTQTSIGNITVTDSEGFAVGKNLDVKITYDEFSAENTSTTIPYTLILYAAGNSGNSGAYYPSEKEITSGSTVTFKGTAAGNVEETIKLQTTYTQGGSALDIPASYIQFNAKSEDWSKALSGEYSTTVTFTAEVVAE